MEVNMFNIFTSKIDMQNESLLWVQSEFICCGVITPGVME